MTTPARPADGVPEEPDAVKAWRNRETKPNVHLRYIDALRAALVESERALAEALSAVSDADADNGGYTWCEEMYQRWRVKHSAIIKRAAGEGRGNG